MYISISELSRDHDFKGSQITQMWLIFFIKISTISSLKHTFVTQTPFFLHFYPFKLRKLYFAYFKTQCFDPKFSQIVWIILNLWSTRPLGAGERHVHEDLAYCVSRQINQITYYLITAQTQKKWFKSNRSHI